MPQFGGHHKGGNGGDANAGNGGSGGAPAGTDGAAGEGAPGGTKGGAGGQAGTSGQGPAGGGGMAGGAVGSGGGGSSNPVFVGGPCIVSIPGSMSVEVFARASNGAILRRAFDGRTWNGWVALGALDGSRIDARSDLDCAASVDTIHVVASGLNPVGALEHAFGFGISYNQFSREFGTRTAAQSPSVALLSNNALYFGWAGATQLPGLVYLETGSSPLDRTPITLLTNDLISAADISLQSNAVYFAAFDSDGKLAVYRHNTYSGGAMWIDAAKIDSPGIFTFSPTICAESGLSGAYSVNVAAVTGHDLWFATTGRAPGWPQFSTWTKIGVDVASSPDCVVLRENPGLDPIIHVAILSSRGTAIDLVGDGMSWVTTDLGLPP